VGFVGCCAGCVPCFSGARWVVGGVWRGQELPGCGGLMGVDGGGGPAQRLSIRNLVWGRGGVIRRWGGPDIRSSSLNHSSLWYARRRWAWWRRFGRDWPYAAARRHGRARWAGLGSSRWTRRCRRRKANSLRRETAARWGGGGWLREGINTVPRPGSGGTGSGAGRVRQWIPEEHLMTGGIPWSQPCHWTRVQDEGR